MSRYREAVATRVLAVGLLVSVSANAYLLTTRTGVEPAHRRAHSKRSTNHPTARVQPTAPPKPPTTVPLPVPLHIKRLDRSALEKRVAETEAKLAELLPPSEMFTLAERTPENEERIRPFLDKIFGTTKGEDPRYDVECHGNVCQLMTDVSPSEWQRELQTDPEGRGMFRGMEFGGHGTFMELQEPGFDAGIQPTERIATTDPTTDPMTKISMALFVSPRVSDCKKENPTPGDLKLTVTVDPSSRWLVGAGGSLEAQAGGVCIRRVLEEILADTPVPPDFTSVDSLVITVEVP